MQDGLVFSGSAHAALADRDAGPRGQDHVDQGDLLKFSEDLSWFVSEFGILTTAAEVFQST